MSAQLPATRQSPSQREAVRSLLRSWRVDLAMSLRNLARTPQRTLWSVGSLAAGVVAVILAGGFIDWNLWYGRESTIHSQLGHLRVFRPGYLDSGVSDPYRYLIHGEDRALALVEASPHVRTVAPRLEFSGLASLGDATLSFKGEGLDPVKERTLSQAVEIIAGDALSPAAPDGVVVGAGLAANLGARPGDRLVLLAKTASGGINAVDARIRGLFATVTKAYDDSVIRLPIALARTLTRAKGEHSWAIVLDDTDATDEALAHARAQLDPRRFEIVPWSDLADFYNKAAALYDRQFGVVKLIIAAVVVFGVSNTMMMSVLERRSEIGTALALGTPRALLLRAFLIEGALLGIAGSVLGVAIGMPVAKIVSIVGIAMPPSPGMSHGFVAGIRVTVPLVLQGVALAAVTALVASAYPAWRASRMPIVDALRAGR